MLSRLREPFGKAGLIVAIVALVAALVGGAYAANGGNPLASASGKNHKQSKAQKGPRGPRGKTGPAGPAGPSGAQGPAGANGKDGVSGTNGANGQSVTVTELGPGECNNGEAGALFTVGGEEVEACNGEAGEEGEAGEPGADGSPWTAQGTLPSNATETGSWSLGAIAGGAVPETAIFAPISFTVPLGADISEENVHSNPVGYEGTPGSDCPGKASAPAAKAGHLCVYSAAIGFGGGEFEGPFIRKSAAEEGVGGASTAGALLAFVVGPKASTWGTWAVTAP